MENYKRTYPTSTTNRNVPKDVFLVAESSVMSGEIKTTYYVDTDGFIWQVGNWVTDKPQPVPIFHLCRLTGDSEIMIFARWNSQP